MPTVAPFKALHFNPSKIRDLSAVVCPPYDNIPEAEIPRYLDKSPYNMVHALLSKSEDDDYRSAAALLGRWKELGVLTQTPRPAYFVYEQTFTWAGHSHRRRTLMATVLLSEFSEGQVRPHENTFSQFKEDRLRILRATRCNLSHVFGMVRDEEGELASAVESSLYHPPILGATTDDGIQHAVWTVEQNAEHTLTGFLGTRPVYIVDGHHRYEAALRYAKESGVLGKPTEPSAYMLFSIASMEDPALLVLPTHRILSGTAAPAMTAIEKRFHLAPTTERELAEFTQAPHPEPAFGLLTPSATYLCRPRDWQAKTSEWGKSLAALSVKWSDHVLMPELCGIDDSNRKQRVRYEKDFSAAWAARTASAAVIVHAPPAIATIANIADEKGFMPQKSTFFYPKLAAGFLMRPL